MLSLLLVELMISDLWGMLTSLAGRYRTSVPSNSDYKPGFKALEALTILVPVAPLLFLGTTKCILG